MRRHRRRRAGRLAPGLYRGRRIFLRASAARYAAPGVRPPGERAVARVDGHAGPLHRARPALRQRRQIPLRRRSAAPPRRAAGALCPGSQSTRPRTGARPGIRAPWRYAAHRLRDRPWAWRRRGDAQSRDPARRAGTRCAVLRGEPGFRRAHRQDPGAGAVAPRNRGFPRAVPARRLEQDYRRRAEEAGTSPLLVQRAVRWPGHCGIDSPVREPAFDDLVAWIEKGTVPAGDDVLGDVSQLGLRWTPSRHPKDPTPRQ